MKRSTLLRLLFTSVILLISGCSPIGPAAVQRDRLNYSTAVADSWKQQLLLNIVKTRYGDAPMFLDVTSVVSGYTLESQVGAGFEYHPDDPEDFLTMGGEVTYTDRPTLSYMPMTGQKFARSLMAPVPLGTLLFILQQKVPADFILGLTLESIEGHQNAIPYSVGLSQKGFSQADPSFVTVLQLLTELQQARVVSSEIIRKAEQTDLYLTFDTAHARKTGLENREIELKKLLNLAGSKDRAKVMFGSRSPAENSIALLTRSLLQIMTILGAGVEIQKKHLEDGSALNTGFSYDLIKFTVYSGAERPESAFVAVPYEGMWFWIDRRDYPTKSTLTALTVLFNFLEGGGSSVSPVLTIPIQ